ncbi:TniQ family protein [Undibacterium sp. Ji83W]|uniref:TniQ family protein n=1 Tax=Undibacterium sp. Ji83W TaxID=3413043 RepID=UPI003BF31F0A
MERNNDFWDLPRFTDLGQSPGRTLLYSLKPMRLGEPMQESLLSFLIRTSRAHAINPRHLVGKVLSTVDPKIGDLASAGFFKEFAKTVNGLGQHAMRFSTALELSTGVEDLQRLTVLPWSNLFPFNGQGMLAEHPQWCPDCLVEQYNEFAEAYYPLVWALEACKVCVVHGRRLQTTCPHCGKHQHFIPRYPDVSICCECLGCLVTGKKFTSEGCQELSEYERWCADAVSNLIALHALTPTLPSVEDFRVFVTAVVKSCAAGNRAALCRHVGLPTGALKGWLSKGERPSMVQLLDFCFGIGSLPASFGNFCQTKIPVTLPSAQNGRRKRQQNQRPSSCRRELIRSQLEIYLHDSDSPPVSKIAVALGLSARCLRYWFPDLCRDLSERAQLARARKSATYQAAQTRRVVEIVQELRLAGKNPSRTQVNRRLAGERMLLTSQHLYEAFRSATNS